MIHKKINEFLNGPIMEVIKQNNYKILCISMTENGAFISLENNNKDSFAILINVNNNS
jgi:hypothetical protein